MNEYEIQVDLLNVLLQLEPNSNELLWERSTLLERWGNALLKRNRFDAALEKYRASVGDKIAVLESETERDAMEADAKRLRLARNYLGIATLETIMERRDEARADCEAAIQTLEKVTRCKETRKEVEELLQDARETMNQTLEGVAM
ncbi:MAG: hypothetical protein IJE97_07135 [Thermoguttaceae bacterium]|nr:hypothetical protein [Thermoguttaceae bacterium]